MEHDQREMIKIISEDPIIQYYGKHSLLEKEEDKDDNDVLKLYFKIKKIDFSYTN